MMALAGTVQALDQRIAAVPVYVAKARRRGSLCLLAWLVGCLLAS